MLTLNTFGNVRVLHDGIEITDWSSRKAVALLVYLAFNSQPQPRDLLATLLWNDQSTARGLANLSVLLSHLRKAIGRNQIIANRHTVTLNWRDPIDIPARTFRKQLDQLPADNLNDSQFALLKQTIDLYKGDFLADLTVRNAHGFEEWALFEREHFQRRVIRALDLAAREAERRKQFTEGIRFARRSVEFDPLREKGQRALMRLLALDGQRNLALAQYADCQRILHEELGVAPDVDTVALFERIKANEIVPTAPRHNLPNPPTSFIGRNQELTQITTQLRDPACRLLTITGLGGVGKTRLALAAAQQLTSDFADGVWWVSLAGLESVDNLVSNLNDILSVPTQTDPQAALFEHLRQKPLLLVLDNFEHLTEVGIELVVALLQQTAAVKLLITSRSRLSLQAEWLIAIAGLPIPTETANVNLAEYAASALFMQRARQVNPEFVPAAQPIVDICRLVEGLPLAVELAASWVRVDDVTTIARLLATDVQLLATTLRDVPERQRSMQAAFDYSWRLLNSAEKTALSQLTYFRGTIPKAAAVSIFAVAPRLLSALCNKSLLTAQDETFQLHPLVRQFAAYHRTDLAAEERNFATYYLKWVTTHADNINQANSRSALTAIQQQLENVRVAWRFALQHEQFAAIDHCINGLATFYRFRGLFQQGITWLEETIAALDGLESAEIITRILGAAYSNLAELQQGVGDFEAGLRSARRGALYAEQIGDTKTVIDSLMRQGLTLMRHGNLRQSQHIVEEARRLTEAARLHQQQIVVFNSLGVLAYMQDDPATAIQHVERSLTLCRRFNNRRGQAIALNNLGHYTLTQEDVAGALPYFEASLAIKQEIGERQAEANTWVNLAVVWFLQADFEQAHACLAAATDIADEINDQRLHALIHSNRALFAVRQGDAETALQQAQITSGLAEQIGDSAMQFHAHHHLGHAYAAMAAWDQAVESYRAAIAAATVAKQQSLIATGQAALASALIEVGVLDEARALVTQSAEYLNTHTALHAVVEPQRVRDTVAKLSARFEQLQIDGKD